MFCRRATTAWITHPHRAAQADELHPYGHQRRCLRQDLRVFSGQIRHERGQRGGEFYAHLHRQADRGHYRALPGRIFDPACGSGGMFVQSARFVEEHRENGGDAISIYGQERISETVRLAR